MSTIDRAALEWLRTHHSTISTAAMSAANITVDQRAALVRSGVLVRVVDGAYALGGVELDELARCAALCTSRPELVIAGPTAGRIWDFRRVPRDGLVHAIGPPASHPCREPWVRCFRTALLAEHDVVERPDGIRLTSPPRTVVDHARYVDRLSLMSIIEHAISRRMCTDTTLRRVAEQMDTPGRPWVRTFLRVLGSRHRGGPSESNGELEVADALARRGVRQLVRQYRVELPGYGAARFDLADPQLRWALEVDLHFDHRTPEGVARDNARDDAAELIGWKVRRVGEVELSRQRFARTIDEVIGALERRATEVDRLRAAGLWECDER